MSNVIGIILIYTFMLVLTMCVIVILYNKEKNK